MKQFFSLFILLILFGCNKNNDQNNSKEIEYRVTTAPAGSFNANYTNELGQNVGGGFQSGWKYSFSTSKKPFTAHIVTGSAGSSITVKILVDNIEVATNTGNSFAETQYVIQ